jgi:hypothetical protein
MRVGANGVRFWFDVDGPALVPDYRRDSRGSRSSKAPATSPGAMRRSGTWPLLSDFVTPTAAPRLEE